MISGFILSRRILTVISLLAIAQSCTPIEDMSKKTVRYEVVKLDPKRGYGWPFEFNRARDLRAAQMFIPAAYVYIHLYPNWKDSVISEAMRMASDVHTFDSTVPLSHYFQQAVGTEMMQDPDIFQGAGKLNRPALDTLYRWTSEILNELNARGVR